MGQAAAPSPSSSARHSSRPATSRAGMRWYERAVAAPDGRASMKAAEQLANVRGRLGWEIVDKATRHLDDDDEGVRRPAVRRARLEPPRGARVSTPSDRCDRRSNAPTDLIEQSLALLDEADRRRSRRWNGRASSGRPTSAGRLSTGPPGGERGSQHDLRQMKAALRGRAGGRREERRLGPLLSRVEPPRRRCGAARRQASDGAVSIARPPAILRKSLAGQERQPTRTSGASSAKSSCDQYEALAAEEARGRPQAAGQGLRGSAQARDGDPDVGVGVRHGVPGAAELRESRRPAERRAAANELLAQLRAFAHPEEESMTC